MTETTMSAAVPTGAKPSRARWGSKGLSTAIIVAGLLTVGGGILWVIQMSGGLVLTNMRNLDSWGLYMTLFMFFVGLSAGGLIISSVPRLFGMKGFGGVSKVAVWSAIVMILCALYSLLVDIGQPLRIWEFLTFSNMISPLMWDFMVITTYLILSIVYLWAMRKNEKGQLGDSSLRIISGFALIIAILVHSVTGWVLGLQVGREFWYTALMGPWFVCSALVSGTALMLVIVLALRRIGYMDPGEENIKKMTKWLGGFIMVELYFFGCDLLTNAYPLGAGLETVQMLVAGPLAPFFWGEIACLVMAAIICFVPRLRKPGLVATAGVLAMLGILFKRVQLITGGFQIPNLDMPGAMTPYTITNASGTFSQAYAGLVYTPQPIEFGIALGIVAFGCLLIFLGIKYLNLQPTDKTE